MRPTHAQIHPIPSHARPPFAHHRPSKPPRLILHTTHQIFPLPLQWVHVAAPAGKLPLDGPATKSPKAENPESPSPAPLLALARHARSYGMSSVTLFPEAAPHSLPPQPCARPRSSTVLPSTEALNLSKLENAPGIVPRRTSFFSIHPSVKMAAERFKNKIKAPHGHHLFRSNSSTLSETPVDEEGRQKERHFIECYECNSLHLTPEQVDETPKNKEVGASSKQLRVGDFELIKTIGTGTISLYRGFLSIVNASLISCNRNIRSSLARTVVGLLQRQGPTKSLRLENTSEDRQ